MRDGNPEGPDWASPDSPLGRLVYTTYSEQDFDIVWQQYAYQQPVQIWFKKDFGKPGCASGGAKHAKIAPTIKEAWHRGDKQVRASGCDIPVRNGGAVRFAPAEGRAGPTHQN